MENELRDYFDRAMDLVLRDLPVYIHKLIAEVPLIVEDHPSPEIMEEFGMEHPDELCGLHDGIALTDRSVEGSDVPMPDAIYIYREGIFALSLDDEGYVEPEELYKQIRITILHEIGHHFGLDEDELARLGYA